MGPEAPDVQRVARRRVRLAILAVAALSVAASCPTHAETPEDRAVRLATDVLHRVGELQSTVIAAHTAGHLDDATALQIVRVTVASARIIRETPYGYARPVQTTLREGVRALPPDVQATYATAFAVIDALLVVILGGP